jgi:hypothetical protein
LREIRFVAIFFLVCFGIFLTLKKLLLEQYHISVYVLHAAVIGALVVAKVVVLLEKTSFGNRFQHGSLIAHAMWRSLVDSRFKCDTELTSKSPPRGSGRRGICGAWC